MRQLKINKKVTNRESESLDKYLHEISKIDLLSTEDEVKYAKKAKNGDQKAIDILVKSNLRFVVSVAKQYQNQGLSLCDLINEGNLGLIKGICRFDETKGFKCISYCVWWIRQSILQAIAEQSRIVRNPTNKIALCTKINKAQSKLEQKLQRTPSIKEISKLLKINFKEIEEAMKNSVRHISMDAPLLDGEDSNLYDIIKYEDSPKPDEDLEKESFKKDINRALETLNERERLVIRFHYGLDGCSPMTLEEVGKECGLTRERVRQIEGTALKRLKNSFRKSILIPYLLN
ncbi:sigma-70 family RNA polymerase sigma factor [Candidatus Shikimatogenerans silvanidophilus]|uniref:sigma-70 family RNA polymerase sigma factor n=1 Tax=Candidatus Shikimatogenerans silvanidophilus TaxID=2782547 RepID=UPI001BA7FFF6|nr:RNA polymerase sigma factor RpoD/SigA [Candidatus Shikimatogenerans silvanidophilus]